MNKQFGFLKDVLKGDSDFLSVLSVIESSKLPAVCTGMTGMHKAASIAAISDEIKRPITVITSGEAEAYALYNELLKNTDILGKKSTAEALGISKRRLTKLLSLIS